MIAVCPSGTEPTISIDESVSNIMDIALRMTLESSTSITVILSDDVICVIHSELEED